MSAPSKMKRPKTIAAATTSAPKEETKTEAATKVEEPKAVEAAQVQEQKIDELRDDIASLREEFADVEASSVSASCITDETVETALKIYQKRIERECNVRVPEWNNRNADAIRAKRVKAKFPPWHLMDYVPVNVRVLAFRRDHPDGLLFADVVPSGGNYLATAYVYTNRSDYKTRDIITTNETDGIKQTRNVVRHCGEIASRAHKVGSDPERAETGAIGRALGFLGYGVVAAIATEDDVREEPNIKRPKPGESDAEGFRKFKRARAGAPEQTSTGEAAKKTEDADYIRSKLVEMIGRKRIFSIEEVEEKFGAIADMDAERAKDVGRKLKGIKSAAAWQKLAGGLTASSRWADAQGGTDLEKLKSYLFAVVQHASKEERDTAQKALDAATELIPFDDIEVEGAKIMRVLASEVDLDAIEERARNNESEG